jgi:hypothetical protein
MHDVSDMAEKPKAQIPCLGCGKRDGLIAPIKGKKEVLWCMRCGTLTDTEASPIDSLLPQLCVHTLSALGVADFETHRQQSAEDAAASEADSPTVEDTTSEADSPTAEDNTSEAQPAH